MYVPKLWFWEVREKFEGHDLGEVIDKTIDTIERFGEVWSRSLHILMIMEMLLWLM